MEKHSAFHNLHSILWLQFHFITARQLPEGNVFRSVCLFTEGEREVTSHTWDRPPGSVPPPASWTWDLHTLPFLSYLLMTSDGYQRRPVQTGSLEDLPPSPTSPSLMVLTPSGGHQNMYGWQAGGMLPTGKLFCLLFCIQDIMSGLHWNFLSQFRVRII